MPTEQHFFEIPIYRTSQERFNQECGSNLKRHLEKLQLSAFACEPTPEILLPAQQRFWETYGGPWQYNQVIGWIRLYVLGSQIRGDLWKMTGKRLQRKSRNQINRVGKIFEIDFTPDESSEEIHAKIEAELKQVQNGCAKKKQVLDLQCFRTIATCVDWRKLVATKLGCISQSLSEIGKLERR